MPLEGQQIYIYAPICVGAFPQLAKEFPGGKSYFVSNFCFTIKMVNIVQLFHLISTFGVLHTINRSSYTPFISEHQITVLKCLRDYTKPNALVLIANSSLTLRICFVV